VLRLSSTGTATAASKVARRNETTGLLVQATQRHAPHLVHAAAAAAGRRAVSWSAWLQGPARDVVEGG
jgi:hypothetical protein